MRAALVLVIGFSLAAVGTPHAGASSRGVLPGFFQVSAAEKRQTRPLADLVLAAHTSGDSSTLCAVWSQQVIRKIGSRARCRSEARQHRQPCSSCRYRISRTLGVYRTASDRRQGRKTVAWLVGVTGDPLYPTAGDLEIRCAQERGRWVLTDILQEGVRVGTLRT